MQDAQPNQHPVNQPNGGAVPQQPAAEQPRQEPAPAAPAPPVKPKKQRSLPVKIIRAILPLILIAVGVYVVYNFPALWERLTYWINPPKGGNAALLPQTTRGNNPGGIPVGGGGCGTDPIKYDGNGNPERICDNYIYIPKIRVAAPIVRPQSSDEGVIDQSLLEGVVKYPGTAEPGEKGNVFLTGHSSFYWWVNTKYRNVFTLVPDLTNGDEIIVYRNGIRYTYRVFTTFEVSPNQTEVLAQTPKPIVTLSTCVPIGTSYRRRIVQAEQISPDPNAARSPSQQASQPARLPGVR